LERRAIITKISQKKAIKKGDRQTREKIKGSTARNYRRRTKEDQMPSLEMRS
jgi:hypothetical protein